MTLIVHWNTIKTSTCRRMQRAFEHCTWARRMLPLIAPSSTKNFEMMIRLHSTDEIKINIFGEICSISH